MSSHSWLTRRWGVLRGVVAAAVVVGLVGGFPAPPASAAVADPPTAADDGGGGWFTDTLWGLFGADQPDRVGREAPASVDRGWAVVPRDEPAVKPVVWERPRRVRELVDRRTAYGRFFQLSDGRVQAEVSAAPVHYRDGRVFRPIDTRVGAAGRSGFVNGNTTNTFTSLFGDRSDRLVRFEVGGRFVELGLAGSGRRVTPRVDGTTVTYPDAAAGADVVYQVTPTALKENLVLRKATAAGFEYTFTVRTGGVEVVQRADESVAFVPRGGGEPVFVMPAPFMYDATNSSAAPGVAGYSTLVTQRVQRRGSVTTITVTADARWLADSARVYPVTIDPTIKIQPVPSDAWDVQLYSGSTATNYNDTYQLKVGTDATHAWRTLVSFPLTGVPPGTALDDAQLQLYYSQTHTAWEYDVAMQAHRVTQPWTESTATWANMNANFAAQPAGNMVLVDDGDPGTSVTGTWPYSGNPALTPKAINADYRYNNDATAGQTHTWVPTITESGDYQVEVHYTSEADRATNTPYTVYYSGGSQTYQVDQTGGPDGVWKTLGVHPFVAGTTGRVVLGDVAGKAVIADAVRFTKWGAATKKRAVSSVWTSFPVRNVVQDWINGTQPNYGFMVKAVDEAVKGRGGPIFEAAEYSYDNNRRDYNLPKLVLTFGRQGVTVNPPTTITATGAALTWPAYVDPSGGSDDNIVEYQVHRSVYQTYTPSAATLVAPVDKTALSYQDTSAVPTPTDETDPLKQHFYYYMLAVKTADGQVLAGPTQGVLLPKAGQITKIFRETAPGQVPDTTLSALRSTTNVNVYDGDPYLSPGNNSSYYGDTRAVVKFGNFAGIPAGAQVVDAQLQLWNTYLYPGTDTNEWVDVYRLTRGFDETTATWLKANATTSWTTPGGDYNPTPLSGFNGFTNDPEWESWDVKAAVTTWLANPTTNHGLLLRQRDEVSATARAMLLSSESSEPMLRPTLQVTYLEPTPESTYHAPATPEVLAPAATYTTPVTVSNPTLTTWTVSGWELSYRWALPDGTDVSAPSNQLATALPQDISPGETVDVTAQVKTPASSTDGNQRTDYLLRWELRNKTTGQWLSGVSGIDPLQQRTAVAEPTSDQLGLEKFYSYTGKNTGAGGTVMNNLYAGNAVWSYNALANPSRGLSTFVRLAYNSRDTSDTVAGYGWSLQASSLMRLGTPLDFHPNPNPTKVTLTDGDGTSHWFTWNATTSEWTNPKGVHLHLQRLVVCETRTEESRAWVLTRPDRTQFFYDCDGYLSTVVDNNGNELRFTYEVRRAQNKPSKFLKYLTDPTGRQTLTIDYWAKGDTYDYINDVTWAKVTGQANLTNPHIIDHVKKITDTSGRVLTFTYTDKGLLGELIDGAGSTQPKVFGFRYDMTQGNKNVKLVRVTDPRGNATNLAYYANPDDDPKFKWQLKTITDRLGHPTTFGYTDPDGQAGETIQTVVTDAENHATTHLMDGYGRPTTITNAKTQVTQLGWDGDHNVTRLEEANGAVSTWVYDQKTGYPTEIKNAEANANNWPATTLAYQTGMNGHLADLIAKQSPEGRRWTFTYTTEGDLATVTDPLGDTTPDPDDYTTTNTYDTWGQLLTTTDANGNTTTHSSFDPNGYPQTITDALSKATTFIYDVRGQVIKVTDALGKDTTQTYDTFGRPLVNKVPKKQAAGEFITTPAPEYDPNDNVTKATAPNGAVSIAVYDDADQVISAIAPKDTNSAPERKTTYTYDKTGHVLTTTEPKGNATADDPIDYTSTNTYNEIYQLTDVVNALGDKISYRFDDVGNVVTVIDPKKNATADPDDYSAKCAYDLAHRLVSFTDALGKTSSTTYDKDSLTLTIRDADGNETRNVYDERGKRIEVKVPYSGTGDGIVYRTTRYEYDQVGNTVRVITPRGTQTANPDDFATRTEYDALNRPVKQFQPYDPADGRYSNAEVYTQTFYDEVGRVSKTSLPPSEGQKTRNDITYTYFDNGWVKSSADAWDIVTTYDYNELGLQTSRTLTSADGDTSRTMGWSYHTNGSLKAKTDDGVPVGSAVPLVDNSDVQHVTATGTWDTAVAAGQQGVDHQVHTAGAGTDTFTWTLNIPKDGRYTAYVKFPAVAGAATTAKFSLTHSGGTTDKTVDQTSGAGTWVSLGAFDFARGNGAELTVAQNADGVVVADGVKLVRDTSGEIDEEKHDFRYGYDLNGNLTSIDDNSSGARIDAYTLAYTELNQVESVTEAVNGEAKRTTSYTYDAVNNPLTVSHPKQFSKYTYDLREKVASVSVGDSANDPSPQVSSYTYTDRGQLATETKGNGNVVTTTYYADQSVRSSTEKKADGSVVASHTYEYDANGNKAKDVAAKMNADDHSATLSSTTEFTYDPADRIAKSVKTGNGATTETYVHDDNANVISQTVAGVSTTFRYDRNRLQTSTTDGAVSGFNFDPFGRQESVTRGGQVVSRSVYDGFDRVIESQRDADGTMKSTKYTFDPLDRTLSTAADGKTTNYTYLGLSDEVLLEEVDGQLSKSYKYSPWGQRLSQVKHNDDGTTEDSYYGYNSHTDVETLTDADGDTKATYGYTTYGNEDKSEFTGIDKPDPANPTKEQYNSFRFNAKRWDPNSETYDMGFRDYSPGLNRFTTRDMYNGALADMGLGSDPFTGNRYAFTGGNPISNVEIDGHYAVIALPAIALPAIEIVVVVAVVAYALQKSGVAEEVQSLDWSLDWTEDEEEPEPTPRLPRPGTDDTDGKEDCTRNGKGWVKHGALDTGNGNRATGVEACLTKDNISGGTGTEWRKVAPPGYKWARSTADHLGGRSRFDIHACHLLARRLGGSGTQLENLATCSADANYKGTSMRTYESQVREAVEKGQAVHYTVTPVYAGNRTVPVAFEITAYGTNPDGSAGISISDIIPNNLLSRNLGLFNDTNTGAEVPIGLTP